MAANHWSPRVCLLLYQARFQSRNGRVNKADLLLPARVPSDPQLLFPVTDGTEQPGVVK